MNNDYNDYEIDLISLIDDDGVEYRFEIIDIINEDDRKFYALSPLPDNENLNLDDDGEYFIMEEIIEEGEDAPILVDIDDDELLDHLSEVFSNRFEELFEYDDEQDDELSE